MWHGYYTVDRTRWAPLGEADCEGDGGIALAAPPPPATDGLLRTQSREIESGGQGFPSEMVRTAVRNLGVGN
jgi:hypothetical protein